MGRAGAEWTRVIPFLGPRDSFPPVDHALRDPDGLLAAGADLSPERLIDAYTHGIFPWFGDDDPILWWSPDPRMVLYTSELHVSRSLQRTIRSGRFATTMDRCFEQVMEGCAEPRRHQSGTWITRDMSEAYAHLFRLGHAHSVEVWATDRLVGGLYGVALGRMFFGESMFSRTRDASKVALVAVARQVRRWDVPCIDCQMSTAHLESMGAREIRRRQFVQHLPQLVGEAGTPAPWRLDSDLLVKIASQ